MENIAARRIIQPDGALGSNQFNLSTSADALMHLLASKS